MSKFNVFFVLVLYAVAIAITCYYVNWQVAVAMFIFQWASNLERDDY